MNLDNIINKPCHYFKYSFVFFITLQLIYNIYYYFSLTDVCMRYIT